MRPAKSQANQRPHNCNFAKLDMCKGEVDAHLFATKCDAEDAVFTKGEYVATIDWHT